MKPIHSRRVLPGTPLLAVLAILAAGVTAGVTTAVAQTTNLLPNPSFEASTGADVSGWKSRAWNGREHAAWKIELPGRTGRQCVSIQSSQGADAAWTATVTASANTVYRLSGWIRTEGVHGAVGALLNIQNLQGVKTAAVTGTEDWTRVSTIFATTAALELEINCLFGGWGSSTGRAWFDDVVLERIEGLTEDTQAAVTIRPGAPSVPYSRMLFGGFLEHFDGQIYGGVFEPGSPRADARGFRRDVVAALKELRVPVIRWPGGCFASGYHWKDGVGRERKPVPDPVWGVVDPNTFGTDEFVELCRLIGCEPYLCTNAGNGTPEEMQEWVEYCNATEGPWARLRVAGGHESPHRVRFWSIGNENWGGHEIGVSTPQKWGPLVARSAKLMLAADPNLVLLAAATPDRGWTLPLLKAAGEHLQYVCIHEYWLGLWQQNDRPGYLPCILNSEGPDRTLRGTRDILREAGVLGRIKIAFDEWNLRGWHHPGFPRKEVQDPKDLATAALITRRGDNAIDAQYTMADALFSASFLNACLRHAADVGMANIAPLVNTRGPLHVYPGGIVRRTTFHTLAMYANLLESRVARVDLETGSLIHGGQSVATIDALATVDDSGRTWALALVNRHPEKAVSCTVRLQDTPLEGRYSATVLSGDSPDAFNDIEHPDRVVPEPMELAISKGVVSLRPHSLTILRVPAR